VEGTEADFSLLGQNRAGKKREEERLGERGKTLNIFCNTPPFCRQKATGKKRAKGEGKGPIE